MNNYFLRCITCKKEFDPQPGIYYCEDCGYILGTLEVVYDYDTLRADISLKERIFDKKASRNSYLVLLYSPQA